MSRVPELDIARLSLEQRRVYESIRTGPRGKVAPPLAVWLESASFADTAQALGAFCRYGSSLPPRLSELAILITGAFWTAGYEWHVHAPLAIEAGIDPAIVEALRTGRPPAFASPDEQAIHDLARELFDAHRVSEPTYRQAVAHLGHKGVVELVGILGYYTLIAMTIKTFELAVPDGATEPFAATERARGA
jgi:4-carboxymuconolactone decarboxylase